MQRWLLLVTLLQAQTFPTLIKQRFWGTAYDDIPKKLIYHQGFLYACGYTLNQQNHKEAILLKIDTANFQVLWLKRFNDKKDQVLVDIIPGEKNYLYAIGYEKDADANIVLYKLDTQGNVLWKKTYGGSAKDIPKGIAKTLLGTLLVAAETWSSDQRMYCQANKRNEIGLLLFNTQGNHIHTVCYGGKKNDFPTAITATNDGGFMVCAITNSPSVDQSKNRFYGDLWLLKLDFTGSLQWSKTIKKPYEDYIYDIVATPDNTFAMVGTTYTKRFNRQFWFLLCDAQGNIVVDRIFGENTIDALTSIEVCEDGGFIVSGYSYHTQKSHRYVKGRLDCWVMRLNKRGRTIWKQTFGGPRDERGVSVCEIRPGTYVLLAEKENDFNEDRVSYKKDFWFVKIQELPCSGVEARFTTDAAEKEKVGTPIRFINQSPLGDAWLWDFGDGTTSTERSPIKRYEKPGVYLVRLTVKVNETCQTTYVYPKAIVIVE